MLLAMGRKPKTGRRLEHVTWVRLDAEIRAWLVDRAKRERLEMSDVVRRVLAEEMDRERAEGRAPGPSKRPGGRA